MLDKEIRREQVQAIRNVDGLVALFAELGHRTDRRAIQTTEPLRSLKHGKWNELTKCLCSACKEPGVMPFRAGEALAEMSRHIQAIGGKRVLRSRSERSHLAPESQPIQDAIDTVIFRCYGLSDEDGRCIEQRLG